MTQLGMAFQEWKIELPVSALLEKGLSFSIFLLKECFDTRYVPTWFLIIRKVRPSEMNFPNLFFQRWVQIFLQCGAAAADWMQRKHWKLFSGPPCSFRGDCQMCTQHSKPLAWPRGWQPLPWTWAASESWTGQLLFLTVYLTFCLLLYHSSSV